MKALEDIIELPKLNKFLAKFDYRGENGCWDWQGYCMPSGYGQCYTHRKHKYVHRVMWEIRNGEIPAGLTIDHLCRNRSCGNPAHMEVVPQGVNTLRGDCNAGRNSRKTHCSNCGNEYDYFWKGHRSCKNCMRRRNREYWRKKRDENT